MTDQPDSLERNIRWNEEDLLEENLALIRENLVLLGEIIEFHPEKITAKPIPAKIRNHLENLGIRLEKLKHFIENLEAFQAPGTMGHPHNHKYVALFGRLMQIRSTQHTVHKMTERLKEAEKSKPGNPFAYIERMVLIEEKLFSSSLDLVHEQNQLLHATAHSMAPSQELKPEKKEEMAKIAGHIFNHINQDLHETLAFYDGLSAANEEQTKLNDTLHDWEHYHHIIHVLEKIVHRKLERYAQILEETNEAIAKMDLEKKAEELEEQKQKAAFLYQRLSKILHQHHPTQLGL